MRLNHINIYWVSLISTVTAIYLVVTNGMNLAFLTSSDVKDGEIASKLLLINQELVVLRSSQIVLNAVFIMGAMKRYTGLIFAAMISQFLLSGATTILQMQNIYWIMDSTSKSFFMSMEIHPLAILIIDFILYSTCLLKWVWVLTYCMKRDIGGIATSGQLFGIDLKIFQTVEFLYVVLILVYAIWQSKRLSAELDIGIQLQSAGPFYYTVASILLILTLVSIVETFFDILGGICKDSYKKVVRACNIKFTIMHLVAPANHVMFVEEMIIFSNAKESIFTKYLGQNIMKYIVVLTFGLLYLLANYMKWAASIEHLELCLIPRRRLKVDDAIPIGTGHSATVYSGIFTSSSSLLFQRRHKRRVAIKVISRSGVDSSMIIEELKNMTRMMRTSHKNLAKFIGVSLLRHLDSDGNSELPLGAVNIVMELYEKGNLLNYLGWMKSMHEFAIPKQQLHMWSGEIGCGMEYLSSLNLVHGDLAARNILLDEHLVAKISDFGMSRQLYQYQVYISTRQGAFPWKWMAPESLDRLEFSLNSDVWSCGVLLWEIFSMGETPWSEMEWTSNFVNMLKAGARLEKPLYASDSIYDNVMLRCWKVPPESRISFTEIVEHFLSVKL